MHADASPEAILARIQARLDALGISANAAGRAAGAVHIIPNLRKGVEVSLRNVVKLAPALETTPEYLAFGVEAEAGDTPAGLMLRSAFPPVATVPIIGEVAASRWLPVDEAIDESPFEGVHVPPDPDYRVEDQFAAVTRGTSVNRVAPDGHILGCVLTGKARRPVRDGDLVVVEQTRYGGHLRERTAKRFQRTDAGFELWPDSTDPQHQEPIRIRRGAEDESLTIVILGIVTWVHRPLDRSERPHRD